MKRVLGILAVVAVLAACGDSVAPNSNYDDGDQLSSHCTDPFHGTAGPADDGTACQDAEFDCNLQCCTCPPSGGPVFFASECYHGACDSQHACDDACTIRAQQQ